MVRCSWLEIVNGKRFEEEKTEIMGVSEIQGEFLWSPGIIRVVFVDSESYRVL